MTFVPGSLGVTRNTAAVATPATATQAPTVRTRDPTFLRPCPETRTTLPAVASSRLRDRSDRYNQSAPSATYGNSNKPNRASSESEPASAISATLAMTENDRSRRRGRSKLCSTWTHTNSEPSVTRAWSTDCACCTRSRNPKSAAARPRASIAFKREFEALRRRCESQDAIGTRMSEPRPVPGSVAPTSATAATETMVMARTTSRRETESSGCRLTRRMKANARGMPPGPPPGRSGTRPPRPRRAREPTARGRVHRAPEPPRAAGTRPPPPPPR